VIANHVQERLSSGEVPASEDGLSISSPNLDLLYERQPIVILTRRFPISSLRTRIDDHTDRIDPCGIDLLDDHFDSCLLDPIAVNKQVKWQRVLAWPGCRDNRFSYSHGDSLLPTLGLLWVHTWATCALHIDKRHATNSSYNYQLYPLTTIVTTVTIVTMIDRIPDHAYCRFILRAIAPNLAQYYA
jgi:hypothetical protein